jgi:hypothetical protein
MSVSATRGHLYDIPTWSTRYYYITHDRIADAGNNVGSPVGFRFVCNEMMTVLYTGSSSASLSASFLHRFVGKPRLVICWRRNDQPPDPGQYLQPRAFGGLQLHQDNTFRPTLSSLTPDRRRAGYSSLGIGFSYTLLVR